MSRGRPTQGCGVTREQKLGLIAGFTVVLLFGVLLADHLSRARTEPLIAANEVDEPLVIPRIEVPARVGAGAMPREPRFAVREPVQGGPIVEPPTETVIAPVTEPRVADGTPRGGPMAGPTIGSIFERVVSAGPREPVSLPGFDPVTREAPVRVEEPRARTHEVKAGESLFRIAERYYDNGHLWRKLAEQNRTVVAADGGVTIGAVLVIPSKAALTGEAESVRVAPAAVPAERTYVVKAGDTLSEISMKLLGTTKRMDELIAMNRDQIRDADDIRVGMELRYRAGPSA